MLKIGITGGIGSGKTTVCGVFEKLGIPVFYSDQESKSLLNNDEGVKESVGKLFGKNVFDEENNIDRKALGSIVFADHEKLKQLNSVLHPAVGKRFEEWCTEHRKNHSIVIKEAAILFESGADRQTDKVITVTAPIEVRISRTMQRDNITREKVLERMKNQWPQEELIKRSWKTIDNGGTQLVIPQCLALLDLLKQNS